MTQAGARVAHAATAVRPALLFAALPQVCYSCSAACCKAPYIYIDPVIEYDSAATLPHGSSFRTPTGIAFEYVLPWWELVSAKFHVRQLPLRP